MPLSLYCEIHGICSLCLDNISLKREQSPTHMSHVQGYSGREGKGGRDMLPFWYYACGERASAASHCLVYYELGMGNRVGT